MKVGQLKGALLEFLMRQLLNNCGFKNVSPDDEYVYRKGGLLMVNGKGAAHDADVLVEPPIQLPFSYPQRLIFEGKSYKGNIGLNIVRGVLGVRTDINNFEFLTPKDIENRKINKYRPRDIPRYNYQVGMIVENGFSAPAIEFAIHYKIPLFSLSWFDILTSGNYRFHELFAEITEANIGEIDKKLVYDLLKRNSTTFEVLLNETKDSILNPILQRFKNILTNFCIGVTSHGTMLLLKKEYYFDGDVHTSIKTSIYYNNNIRSIKKSEGGELLYKFQLPQDMQIKFNQGGRNVHDAYGIKTEFLGHITVFSSHQDEDENGKSVSTPQQIVLKIDENWLRDTFS